MKKYFGVLLSLLITQTACTGGNDPKSRAPTSEQSASKESTSNLSCDIGKKVLLIKPDASTQEIGTIQAAVDQSTSGDKIFVGPGEWNEIGRLTQKSGIEISSSCSPTIKGLNFAKSQNITIRGLTINAENSGANGITFGGGSDASQNITLSQVEVVKANGDYDGVWVGNGNSGINFQKSSFKWV